VGVFSLECEVRSVRDQGEAARVRVLVDSGSEFTWLPGAVLERAGVSVAKAGLKFVKADGRTITRPIGYAILRASGFETVDEVVFAEPGDLSLLGARTLEGFGAVVDARGKRLVAAGPHPAASVAGQSSWGELAR
jgi:predicted aspartyl protease